MITKKKWYLIVPDSSWASLVRSSSPVDAGWGHLLAFCSRSLLLLLVLLVVTEVGDRFPATLNAGCVWWGEEGVCDVWGHILRSCLGNKD